MSVRESRAHVFYEHIYYVDVRICVRIRTRNTRAPEKNYAESKVITFISAEISTRSAKINRD